MGAEARSVGAAAGQEVTGALAPAAALLATCAIAAAALADGLTDQQIAFAARVVKQESGGNQYDPRTGRVLTSSAGAKGFFQLMPATAAMLRVNPDTPDGNVRGGLSHLFGKDGLWDRYHGDQRLIAVAYNCGERCLADWLAGRRTLPDETTRYVAAVAEGGPAARSVAEPQVLPAPAPVADPTDELPDDPADPRPPKYDLVAFAEWKARHATPSETSNP